MANPPVKFELHSTSSSDPHSHHTHSHEGHQHSHGDHGHTHEILDTPGSYLSRSRPLSNRDYKTRAFTVGIGGPVGSGKTALLLALCQRLSAHNKRALASSDSTGTADASGRHNWKRMNLAVVTNDIFTKEDGEFLVRNEALPKERIRPIETGGCPHAAIREDISTNLDALEALQHEFGTELLLIESGGDNLAANYSRELADFIIYVIDVSGGDKIPRKGGPGITESDLLVINKTDIASYVGSDLKVMERDANQIRQGGPTVFAQVKNGVGVDEIIEHILQAYRVAVGLSTA